MLGGYYVYSQRENTRSESTVVTITPSNSHVNVQATFDIYTFGTHRIFTDSKYHNRSSEVFIDADEPTIIHVTKETVTWKDFFSTLPMTLTKECLTTGTKQTFCSGSNGTLRFYLNDREEPNALEKIIHADDHLVVQFK